MEKINFYENYTTTTVQTGLSEKKQLDMYMGNYNRHFKYHILPHLPLNKEIEILDIGCGYGRTLQSLKLYGYQHTTGVDISKEQVQYALEQAGLLNIYLEDSIEFLKKQIDSGKRYNIILLLDVLEHIELEESIYLLRLTRDALKDNGRLLIQVPCAHSPLSPLRYGDITHQRAYTTYSMAQCLLLAGFNKFNHFAMGPVPHGIKSGVRWVLWHMLINPLILAYMLAANSDSMGGIYTANMLTVADKISKS